MIDPYHGRLRIHVSSERHHWFESTRTKRLLSIDVMVFVAVLTRNSDVVLDMGFGTSERDAVRELRRSWRRTTRAQMWRMRARRTP